VTRFEEHVRFQADGSMLEGRLFVPEQPRMAAVLCHPHPQYGGTMDNNVVRAVAEALQGADVATLRFNFRGVGESTGHYGGGRAEVDDARAAVELLRQRLPRGTSAEVTLAGYSFGALVALLAGHPVETPNWGLVAIAPPVSMFDVSFLNQCGKPKLFVLGDHDQYCPLAAMEKAFASLAEPKSLVRIAGADHFFADDASRVAEAVANFISEG
jgi:alpha/beta superfamily hydrolase